MGTIHHRRAEVTRARADQENTRGTGGKQFRKHFGERKTECGA